ncbi:hypothetical protein TrLO_g1823 [Triparma laevis f. longispina]|uniref:Uncharacterized protein n=1 Tax=Triparma laevis f. longispina TaxID=1714387 RepID=A0A9W7EAD0_9STRA|nr:hypothetical protein TrLO_g1823 [Triparma laevis f. longispina]
MDIETGQMSPDQGDVEMTGLPAPDYSKQTDDPDDLLVERSNYNIVFLTIGGLSCITLANAIYLLAFSVIPSVFAYATLLSAFVVAPYSVYSRWRLQSLDGFLEVENRIRREVNRLTVENVRLSRTVNKLEGHVEAFGQENERLVTSIDDLKMVEKSMADLAGSAGTSLESMKSLIEQNKNVLMRCEIIQRQTQNLCTSMSMQNLFSLILQCDVDGSGNFCEEELKLIAEGMKGLEPDFREDVFYCVLKRKRERLGIERNTLSGMMEVARNMMNDDLPERDRIIARKPPMTRNDLPPTVRQSLNSPLNSFGSHSLAGGGAQ